MNKFKKYCENVFVAETNQMHKKGDIIELSTKHGKIVECEVFNLVGQKNDVNYYSIVRLEDESYSERKANKYKNSSSNHQEKSDKYYEASNEGKDFLSLGEPIKIGHHSERRHRALIERNNNRMRKSIEASNKAKEAQEKSEYWLKKASEINLSMPESLEYYTQKLQEAKALHKGLKDGSIKKEHSYSVQYANKDVKNLTRKVELATKLWG